MYSIGQVSEMFGLPVSTLRYYDKRDYFLISSVFLVLENFQRMS